MAFTGNENHAISLADAAQLTENFRLSVGTGAFLAAFFGKTALTQALSQDGCVGIRIYNAKSATGQHNYVLVGVNDKGDDLTGGIILEFGVGCPPFCSPSSELAGTA